MATRRRRRTASWIQPPGEEKVLEKGGHGAKEGWVGAADIILLLITAKWRGPPKAGVPYGLLLESSVV